MISLKPLLFLTFLLSFCQYFVISLTSVIYVSYFSVFIVILYALLIIKNYNKFIVICKNWLQYPIFKSFVILFSIIIICTFINIILGRLSLNPIYYIHHWRDLLFGVLFVYTLPLLAYSYNIKEKEILKFFVIVMYFICILGIFGYIGAILKLNFITNITNYLGNKFLLENFNGSDIRLWKDCNRAFSVFAEPSEFAQCIFLSLPILYSIVNSKLNLFKIVLVNKFTNTLLIPLVWLNLILTKSPIFLIFCLFIHIIYYKDRIKFLIFKKSLFCIILCIITLFCLSTIYICLLNTNNIDIKNLYIYRICETLQSFSSFDDLIEHEASLATRLLCYINLLRLFIKNFLIGVGYYNSGIFMYNIFNSSPLMLTNEILYKLDTYSNNVPVSRGIIYTILAETGVFGGIALIWFYVKNLIFVQKIKMQISYKYNIFYGLEISLIAILINSFYNLYFDKSYLWIIFGFIVMFQKNTIDNYRRKFYCE